MIDHLLIAATRFLVGGHPEWVGSEPTDTQRVYFANHGSHLDAILIWAALPGWLRRDTHPVAAADYWGRGPLRRKFAIGVLGSVLIDRKGGEGDPLAPLEATLAAGESLIIFPEGTRGREERPGAFRSGLFNLATRFPDVELVPVHLRNLSRAFPKGAHLPVPISCHVRFGPALGRIADEPRAAFLTRARDAVIALI